MLALCALCGFVFGACGQKGPPLAPLVFLPTPVSELIVRRHGDNVVIQFKVPVANTDRSTPADLDRIEVYAHTGPLPTPADYVKFGTLIQTIPVKQPPPPTSAANGSLPAAKVEAENVKPDPPGTVAQGFVTHVSETLTEAHKTPGPMPFQRVAPAAALVESLETPATVGEPVPITRYYTVVGVSRSRNRRGGFTPPVGVQIVAPPETPRDVNVAYVPEKFSVQWAPMAGDPPAVEPKEGSGVVPPPPPPPEPPLAIETAGTVQEPAVAEAQFDVETPGTATTLLAPPVKPLPPPVPSLGYNVYEGNALQPLNAALLTTPTFADPNVAFGTERCFVVRRATLVGTVSIESEGTAAVCVTPVDTFPPGAPKNLTAVTSEGSVSLLWEGVGDKDVAGYVVLRGDAPGETLASLYTAPIRETTFRDTTVQPGRTYVYAVVALDTAAPPNRSEESNRVTETVR